MEDFLNENALGHLVQCMTDEGVTLELLLEATDSELCVLCHKIVDKIKLRAALDKLRKSLNECKKTNRPSEELTVLGLGAAKFHNDNLMITVPSALEAQPHREEAFDLTSEILHQYDVNLVSKDTIETEANQEWTLSQLNTSELLGSLDLKTLGAETAGKSLHQLLSSVSVGKVLLAKADSGEQLTSQDRGLLVRLIVETELNALDTSNKTIRKDVWQKWTKEIVEIFKKETPDVYYVPYRVIDGRVIQASGLFQNRLITHRRYLNSDGQSRKRSISCDSGDSGAGSSKSDETSKRVRPLPQSYEPSKSPESLKLSSLEWLKGASSPEHILIDKWKSTFNIRQKLLSRTTSYREYFSTFPGLKLPIGYQLLSHDFDAVYPTGSNSFNENFSIVKSNLLTLLTEKGEVVKPDHNTLDLLMLATEGEEQANVAAFLSIPLLMRQMPTINVPRKKLWKLSREEVRSAFIAKVTTAADIERFCADREAFVVSKGIPEQPYIIAVGVSWSTVTQYEVVVHSGLRYQLSDICGAITTAFKIYWALDCAYPKDSAPCWMFIQRAIYKMKSKFDVESVPLRELLNKIQL